MARRGASRRTVACWDQATARRLWQALPQRYHRHYWYFTDEWKARAKVLPHWQHRPGRKGEGQISIVEASNCSLRQRGGALVRELCSFSEFLKMRTTRSKIIIDNYNRSIIPK